MIVDYLKSTIDNKPMESLVPGEKPTIQNTSNWKLEQKQKEAHHKFVGDIIDVIRGTKN